MLQKLLNAFANHDAVELYNLFVNSSYAMAAILLLMIFFLLFSIFSIIALEKKNRSIEPSYKLKTEKLLNEIAEL